MKYLFVFDFDDTIVKTDWKSLSDFRRLIKSATPIKKTVNLLKRIISVASSRSDSKVVVLTARPIGFPVSQFLKSIGIIVEVVAVNDKNFGAKKADWVENQVKNYGYNNIMVLDDKMYNIDKITNRLKKYKDITLKTILIR